MRVRVLLVSDDSHLARRFSPAIEAIGMQATVEDRLLVGLDRFGQEPSDIIVLSQRYDLLAAVKRVREIALIPLLLLTDPLSDQECSALFVHGATVIMLRTASPQLVCGQIRALLRESVFTQQSTIVPDLVYHDVILDAENRTIRVAQQKAQPLTRLEFRLLYLLMKHPEHTVSNEQIIQHLWGYDEGDEKILRNLVWRVRQKMKSNPERPRYLQNMWGVGYAFYINPSA